MQTFSLSSQPPVDKGTPAPRATTGVASRPDLQADAVAPRLLG